jgi:hypothetical protein
MATAQTHERRPAGTGRPSLHAPLTVVATDREVSSRSPFLAPGLGRGGCGPGASFVGLDSLKGNDYPVGAA